MCEVRRFDPLLLGLDNYGDRECYVSIYYTWRHAYRRHNSWHVHVQYSYMHAIVHVDYYTLQTTYTKHTGIMQNSYKNNINLGEFAHWQSTYMYLQAGNSTFLQTCDSDKDYCRAVGIRLTTSIIMITDGTSHMTWRRHGMPSHDYVTHHMITWEPHDSFSAEGSV